MNRNYTTLVHLLLVLEPTKFSGIHYLIFCYEHETLLQDLLMDGDCCPFFAAVGTSLTGFPHGKKLDVALWTWFHNHLYRTT